MSSLLSLAGLDLLSCPLLSALLAGIPARGPSGRDRLILARLSASVSVVETTILNEEEYIAMWLCFNKRASTFHVNVV